MTSRVALLREPNPELLRSPPYNTAAEQALLGAILINNTAYYRVCEFLQPEHFGNAVHGRIFAAIGKLLGRGQIANPVTLKNLFDQDGALTEIGGRSIWPVWQARRRRSSMSRITAAPCTTFTYAAS